MAHDQEASYTLAAGAVFLPVCCAFVGLRFLTRYVQKTWYGADDWLTIPALLLTIGCSLNVIIGVKKKVYGYPSLPPPPNVDPLDALTWKRVYLAKLTWSFFMLQILAIGFIKLSFVFFFRRIFLGGSGKIFRIVSLSLIVILCGWMVSFFFALTFQCGTHYSSRFGSIRTLRTDCSADVPTEFGLSISDFVTDIFVLILPIPMVLRLRLDIKRRVGVLFVFGLGFIALAASAVRFGIFIWASRLSNKQLKEYKVDEDYLTTRTIYWSMLETGLALMACCLPALSGLIRSSTIRAYLRSFPSLHSRRMGKSDQLGSKDSPRKPQKKGPRRMPGESILSDVPFQASHGGTHVGSTSDADSIQLDVVRKHEEDEKKLVADRSSVYVSEV